MTQIPVSRKVSSRSLNGEILRDSTIERYNLIFFDFNSPKVSKFNESTVSVILNRIRLNSAVNVFGFTDRIGSDVVNKKLSEARAEDFYEKIKSRIVPNKLDYTGNGAKLIYNNDFPEGRFYNRTVIVEIATPLDK